MYAPKLVFSKIIPATQTQFGIPFTAPVQSPSLLLHFEGPDASTTFTDSSVFNHPVVVSGTAQIDTAQFKFGTASGLFSPGGGSFIDVTDNNGSLAFSTGDYTVDFWIRWNDVTNRQDIWCVSPGGTTIFLLKGAVNTLSVAATGIGNVTVGTTVVAANIWYHVAVTRQASLTRLFLNGGLEGTPGIDGNDYLGDDFRIGESTGNIVNGWIDEFRVIKGLAVWTAPFTPPAAPYSPP